MPLLHRKCCFTSKNVQIAFFGNSSRMCQYNLLGRNWSVFVVRIRRSQVKTFFFKSSNIYFTRIFCLNNYPPFNYRLIITEPHSKKIFVDVHTSHRANIFSAKFLPASNIRKIVSCAGDGNILFTGNFQRTAWTVNVVSHRRKHINHGGFPEKQPNWFEFQFNLAL